MRSYFNVPQMRSYFNVPQLRSYFNIYIHPQQPRDTLEPPEQTEQQGLGFENKLKPRLKESLVGSEIRAKYSKSKYRPPRNNNLAVTKTPI